jgi:aminopeptidase N
MKKLLLNGLLLCILLNTSILLMAQPEQLRSGPATEMEKRSWTGHLLKAGNGVENNYDLKYHRFVWNVNPSFHAISGSVTSYFIAKGQVVSRIQFELAANMFADSAVNGSMPAVLLHDGNILTVRLNREIASGALDSVTVYYHGSPDNSGFGSFVTDKHNDVPVLWTLSEPYGASEWWPSKNDLTDKIDSIDVYVIHPESTHAASNGLLMAENSGGDGRVITHWKHRYPIASYLIAIAVTNYSRFSDTHTGSYGSFDIANYVYPEDSAYLRKQAQLVLPVLDLFEELFGPYPFREEKYGQAEFGWGGGMEHQTMTFLGRGAFNHEIIAHELAHQWFGNTITCGSWHDIWLNEGFATYSAGLTYEHMFNGYYWSKWNYQNMSYVTMEPGGSVYCDDTTSVDRIFDSRLSYSKGALVLHMLRWVIGDQAFFAGLKSYFNDPALHFGFARTADFQRHVEEAAGRDLNWFFSDWIYGQGYPSYKLTCTQNADNNAIINLEQSTSHTSVSFFRLPVPVCFYGGGRDTTIVFDNTYSDETFYIEPGFTIDSIKIDPERWIISAGNSVALIQLQGEYLNISPNPACDEITVYYNPENEGDILIFGLDGRRYHVAVKEKYKGWAKIDVKSLPCGVYLLCLAKGNKVGKFLVTR